MPPATAPVPVLILEALAAKLALPDGGADYYHDVAFAGIGRDIAAPAPEQYPVAFIGEPGEVGQYQESKNGKTLWHGTWYWDLPVFGVVRDVGGGDESYKNLLKLAADIYRAVTTDYTLSGTVLNIQCTGWTLLGPQTKTDGRPWVAVLFRALFRTKDTEMVTHPA